MKNSATTDGSGRTRSASPRWTARGLAVLASAAVVGVALAAPGGAAAATTGSTSSHAATLGVHYAVDKPLCATDPKPGFASCFAVARVAATASTPGATPYTVTAKYPTGNSGGLTPADFATAYGYNRLGGKGQTVGIVDAYDDPNIGKDLNAFDKRYGFPVETATSFVKVGETGKPTVLPKKDTTGWSGEESLDVETVRSVCAGCKIILVEVNNPSDANLSAGVKTAVKLGATEVSNSYGGPEGKAPKIKTKKQAKKLKAQLASYQKLYNFPGVVITASTGDDGWFSWDGALNENPNTGAPQGSAESPNLPSTLPNVVSVGGTKLTLNANGTRASESVWNENGQAASTFVNKGEGQGATGGGCSNLYKAAGWQANVAGYAKTGCGKHRLAADISADADPASGIDVYDTFRCATNCTTANWTTIGGTSLSSPLVAAMWAVAGGAGKVAYPALSLYGHSSKSLYDVTQGGNSWCDGLTFTNCSTKTKNEIKNVVNPNNLAVDNGADPLGTLDCAFQDGTKKAVQIKDSTQCNATTGFDGPSGLGTPAGLSVFTPVVPIAKLSVVGHLKHKKKSEFEGGKKDPFPGGEIVKYHWNFGDHHTGHGRKPTHTYKKKGKYTVTLKVIDSYGQKSKTLSVRVKVK